MSNDDSYRKLDSKKAAKVLSRLTDLLDMPPFSPDTTVVFSRPLSFLPHWSLVEAADGTSLPERRIVALDDGKRAVVVDYGAALPAEIASTFQVNHDTVCDYVRFYLTYARSGADRFILVENIDDMPWRDDMGPSARKSLGKQVIPLTLVTYDGQDCTLKASLLFRNTLFEATIKVTEKGKVTVKRDSKIAEDLSVFDVATGF